VAQEVPETLLLAEAFWMMEGYFVRTLGMHRVYNSAFMNMLRAEENVKYRTVLKNTLQFEPRFEALRQLHEQPGRGHLCRAVRQRRQVFRHLHPDGDAARPANVWSRPGRRLRRKYGMEYPRAYWDETPDEYLVQRHQREIFPCCIAATSLPKSATLRCMTSGLPMAA
jgi:hypothetical protein